MAVSSKYLCACLLAGLMFSTSVFSTSSPNNSSSAAVVKPLIAAEALTFSFPNGKIAIKKPNDAPYCAQKGTCDFSVDCYGNLGAPTQKGMTWACKNEPGFCVGQCYLTPVSDKETVIQKTLDILATN